jgi:glucokinase
MAANWDQGGSYVGVDLAAPKILAGAFDAGGKLLGKVKFSAKVERGPQRLLERVARVIREVVDECDLKPQDVRGIGVAVPGRVDAPAGMVRFAPLLGWENFPLQAELEQRLQAPVVLENECNAAAWGVYQRELKAQPKSLVAVFLDRPGVMARVVDGQFEPEFPEYLRAAFPALQTDPREPVSQNLPKRLRKAIQNGSEDARRLVSKMARDAGSLVAQTITVLRPEVLALDGGAIYELKEWLLAPILREIERQAPELVQVQVRVCHLGREAALIGAALLAARKT